MTKRKTAVSVLFSMVLFTFLYITAYAVVYIYYSGGLISASVEVENRVPGDYPYTEAVNAWNTTVTPVYITTVSGSGHSYIITGQYGDEFFGEYTPKDLEYILWGRAGKFEIRINRDVCVNESANFRQSVIVHELGHAFCLDDNPSTGNSSIMNYDRNRNTLIAPTSCDVSGVNYAY